MLPTAENHNSLSRMLFCPIHDVAGHDAIPNMPFVSKETQLAGKIVQSLPADWQP